LAGFYQKEQNGNLQFYIPTKIWQNLYPGRGEVLLIPPPRASSFPVRCEVTHTTEGL